MSINRKDLIIISGFKAKKPQLICKSFHIFICIGIPNWCTLFNSIYLILKLYNIPWNIGVFVIYTNDGKYITLSHKGLKDLWFGGT